MDITMNTVTSLQTTCSRENIVRLFTRFANKYGTLWTNRLGANPDWEACINDWFEDLKHFDYKTLVLAAKSALATFSDFPPTFGQFEDLCKKHSGFLQRDDAIKMLIARDFSHPIVKIMYDKIGSWTLTNGKETEVQAKAKDAYREAESEFTLFPDKCWAQLESFNAKPKELPPPPKIPTAQEQECFKSLKERVAEYAKIQQEAQASSPNGKTYREFDEKAINPNHRDFNEQIFNEYRDYLLSIPEERTMMLPGKYVYARSRFINQREQPRELRERGHRGVQGINENATPRPFHGAKKVYQCWASPE